MVIRQRILPSMTAGGGDRDCRDGRAFGHQVRTTLEDLMVAIYAAREGPPADPAVALPQAYAASLNRLRQAALARLSHRHDKFRALAVEPLNDWEAIFQVVHLPELPLSNHDAERALRHWVIARRLRHGTRTAVGSRAFTLLASVIDTCRQRGHSPWTYLVTAITDRRAGLPLAPLPQPGVRTFTSPLIREKTSRPGLPVCSAIIQRPARRPTPISNR